MTTKTPAIYTDDGAVIAVTSPQAFSVHHNKKGDAM